MLDSQDYEILKAKYQEYFPLYIDESVNYRVNAFNDVLETLGMVLKKHDDEVEVMEKFSY